MGKDAALLQRVARLRTHGATRVTDEMVFASDGPWYYEQQDLGFNYRLTDLQAALGVSQLARLDSFLARRRALAERYDALLSALPVARPPMDGASAWHLYAITVREPARRRAVFDCLRAADVGVNVHYIPVHLQPYYRGLGFGPGMFPAAEAYYQGALTLPLHAQLTDEEQDFVVARLREALQ